MSDFGKRVRLNRITGGPGNKALIVAFDHGLVTGPIHGITDPASQLKLFAECRVDGVLLNLGILRQSKDSLLQESPPAIIVRLDWTSLWTSKGPIGSTKLRSSLIVHPAEAMRYGAEAVLTFLVVGTGDADFESEEIKRNARVARECERLGIPLIVESVARGPKVGSPADLQWVQLHTRMAAELGADAIKAEFTGQIDSMRNVVENCPIPIFVLGGSRLASDEEALSLVDSAVKSGAAGVFFGRNVFQATDSREFLRRTRNILSGNAEA